MKATNLLKGGKQTEINEYILDIASQIEGAGWDFIVNTVFWVNNNVPIKQNYSEKARIFRKRTAEQIIIDGFSTGCTDTALAFIVLCRAKKIPTKYVEAIDKKWLEGGGEQIQGHVFAEAFLNKNWYIIDPARGLIHILGDRNVSNRYVVYKKGSDSWDIGIDSLESLKVSFEKYRKSHITRLKK